MGDGTLRYGGSGSVSVDAGSLNFAGAAFNTLSFNCTPIEMLANDDSEDALATATGFFWRWNGRPFLITNWHVVSGRNSLTGKLNSDGYVPKRLRFFGLSAVLKNGATRIHRQAIIIEFNDEMIDLVSKGLTIDGQLIDIWAMPIPHDAVFAADGDRSALPEVSCFINERTDVRIATNVGDDCFILGYPLKNYEGMMPPVWKRASIASETPLGIGGRPVFLVDASTTSGMSGSPIVRKATSSTSIIGENTVQENSVYEIVGVYAGRLESGGLGAVNIGYGWYRTLIDRMLDEIGWSPLVEGRPPVA